MLTRLMYRRNQIQRIATDKAINIDKIGLECNDGARRLKPHNNMNKDNEDAGLVRAVVETVIDWIMTIVNSARWSPPIVGGKNIRLSVNHF